MALRDQHAKERALTGDWVARCGTSVSVVSTEEVRERGLCDATVDASLCGRGLLQHRGAEMRMEGTCDGF